MNTEAQGRGLVGKKVPKGLIRVCSRGEPLSIRRFDSMNLLLTPKNYVSQVFRAVVEVRGKCLGRPVGLPAPGFGRNTDKSGKGSKSSASGASGKKFCSALALILKVCKWSDLLAEGRTGSQRLCSAEGAGGPLAPQPRAHPAMSTHTFRIRGGKSFPQSPDQGAVMRNQTPDSGDGGVQGNGFQLKKKWKKVASKLLKI